MHDAWCMMHDRAQPLNSRVKNERTRYCFFPHFANWLTLSCRMQTPWLRKLSRPSWYATHFTPTAAQTHSQPSISTSAPCKLSLTPGCRDLCQTCVTVWGTEVTTPSTHSPVFICLFVGLCSFISRRLPSLCPSSTLRFSHDPLLSDLFSDLSPLTTLQWPQQCWITSVQRGICCSSGCGSNSVRT